MGLAEGGLNIRINEAGLRGHWVGATAITRSRTHLPDGTIAGMGDRVRGYAHRVDIAGDAQSVWRAFTDAAHLAKWCAPGAQIGARAGGLFRASVDRVTEMEAHIDVFEPGRRLRLIYLPSTATPASESAIVADFIMEASPPGTIVRVLGSGVPDDPAWDLPFKRMRTGWERAMARLKVYVEKQMGPAPGGRKAP
jgi:uncharacterized protein YndB with AHSA1/START domain